MIKKLKSNNLLSTLLIIVCFIIIINSTLYAKTCLDAISVWAFKVMPLLFPFFIFTRLIVNISEQNPTILDKFFNKAYNTPQGSFKTFFLSVLSGYPMGAKLICTMHENKQINSYQATKMLSFCSVCGPMFMFGTVGIMMLKSYKAGLIILISNIVAALINGLIYRGKKEAYQTKCFLAKKNDNILADSVYDSLISILMIGAYIVLSFLVIEILKTLHIFDFLTTAICCVFNCNHYHNVVSSVLCGSIEITKGILELSSSNASLFMQTVIASTLVGFGGLSIFLQSLNFLSKLKISVKTMLKQKTTQAILCFILSLSLCFIFL